MQIEEEMGEGNKEIEQGRGGGGGGGEEGGTGL